MNFFTCKGNIFNSKRIAVMLAVAALGIGEKSWGQVLWSSAAGSAWLTGTNWTGSAVPTSAQIAQFGANPTGATGVGINFANTTNAGTQTNGSRIEDVGAVEVTSARAAAMIIGNSSGTAGATGTFRLYGITVNSLSNVIIRNNSSQLLTIQNTQATGNQTMGVTINNATDNIVNIDGTGGVTISSIVSDGGSARKLTKGGTGTGILQLTGANTYTGLTTVSAGTLQLNRTGGTTIPVTNNVTVSGGTLKVSTNQTLNNLTLSSGTLQIDANITLTVTGTYSASGGTINNLGTIKLNGGAVSFPGSGVTVNNGTANTMTNLEVASSGNVSLSASLILSGALTLTSSNLAIGSNTLTANGTITKTSGKFDGTSSSVLALGGASAQDITFATNGALSMLNVNKTGGTATLNSALNIYTGITFTGNTGTLNLNSQNLTLKSDATKTAYVGTIAGTLSGAGNVTVERYLPLNLTGGRTGKAWRLLTVPVTGTTIKASWQENPANLWDGVTALTSTGYGTLITGQQQGNAATANGNGFDFWSAISNSTSSIRYHNGLGTGAWLTYTNINALSINDKEGYLLYVRGDRSVSTAPFGQATTLRATGTLKQGTLTPAIIAAATSTFTLIGNPYASPVNFENIYLANQSLIQPRFTVWDANLGNTGGYRLVERTGLNTYTITPPGGATTTAQHIQSGQAFFLEALSAGGSLSIQESHKSTGGTDAVFLKGGNTAENKQAAAISEPSLNINLSLKNTDNSLLLADGAMVRFSNKYTKVVTGEDVLKAFNFAENIAIGVDTFKLISERRPSPAKKDTVYLKLWNTSIRDYQLAISNSGFTLAGATARLIDKFLNTSTNIPLDGSSTPVNFSITADTASKSIDRFYIIMPGKRGTAPVVAAAEETAKSATAGAQLKAFPNPANGGNVTLSLDYLAKGNYEITVFNNSGIKMLNVKIKHAGGAFKENIIVAKFTNGVYNIQLKNTDGTEVKTLSVIINK